MEIDARNQDFRQLNQQVKDSDEKYITIHHCLGQRFIAAGLDKDKELRIEGIAGNALAAYLNGATVITAGNAQDAVGDTMNGGRIIIHGSCGDGAGYAMRGGQIFIHGDVGYRAGIHMKAYQQQTPVMIVGGRAGSFLGEYQAGGIIAVLGLYESALPLTGFFCGTGMHGGRIYLRGNQLPADLPEQISLERATAEDMALLRPDLEEFCRCFGESPAQVLDAPFWVLTPNSKNPYRQLYCYN